MFNPHAFQTTVLGCPRVKVSLRAATDMWILTDIVSTEVGWLTTARLVKENGERVIYVDDVYLFKQQVHSTTTELTSEGLSTLGTQLIAEDMAAGIDPALWRANNLRGYFHSHVNMDVLPSGQDNDQTMAFRDNYEYPWVLRGIVNKRHKMKLDFFWFEMDIVVEDIDWEIDYAAGGDRKSHWGKEVNSLVESFYSANKSLISYPYQTPTPTPRSNFVDPHAAPMKTHAEFSASGQQAGPASGRFGQFSEETFWGE